ncbi:MAG: hypothetical protein UU23_C0006G0003 [Candidatus Curtissbacteria bacterium GW2011_GWA1_40_9]|uniref:Glycosyltransferase RgtA/B/C/D-like domain-containing protein n=1 Tax=Candidatus Curtissbacteria bacterium GW2011_GWA1_40_9 TaxID=1618408 RepID=A0A0G0TLP9_9BACT|nr:MAG: hypothetical protein UU23_C0006G0003 [Candidatus Curtissbacteria bacterium GW2011_GWA1_40_9]
MFSRFIVDPDFGWHVAIGDYILKNGEILKKDIFSWTMGGYVWGNSYLLYEVFVSWFLEKFGFVMLVFLFAAIGAFGFSLLIRKLNLIVGFLVFVVAFLPVANLGVRPYVFSFLFFSLLLLALEHGTYKKPIFSIVFFLAFALWANVHRGFVFAILIFGTYLTLEFLSKKSVNRWALVSFVASILGSFVTPFPFKLWSSGVVDDFRTWENLAYIAEWLPTAFFYPVNILFAISGIVFVYMLVFGNKKINPVWFMVGAFSFAFAFVSVNLISFWVAIFVFLVSRHLELPFSVLRYFGRREWIFLGYISLICAFVIFINFVIGANRRWGLSSALISLKYPVSAIEYLNDNEIYGNMFNEYRWGGYLVWQGKGRRVFIDGRMAGWKRDGVSILGDYMKVSNGECDVMSKYDIEIVIVSPSFNIGCFEGFHEVWSDDVSRVLVR